MQCSSSPWIWMRSWAMWRCSIINIWTMCTESSILGINGTWYYIFTVARLSAQYSTLHHNPPLFFCAQRMAWPLGIIITGYAKELNLPEWKLSTSLQTLWWTVYLPILQVLAGVKVNCIMSWPMWLEWLHLIIAEMCFSMSAYGPDISLVFG
jgi:hypothetical protein